MKKQIEELAKSFNLGNTQLPEIISDDGSNRMDPSVMNFLMLSSIASQVVKIRKYFDDRTPIGKKEDFNLNITPVAQLVELSWPAQTFFIVNDGPGQIFVTLNTLGETTTPLLVTETIFLNFEVHLLGQFYVASAIGTIATARAMVRG